MARERPREARDIAPGTETADRPRTEEGRRGGRDRTSRLVTRERLLKVLLVLLVLVALWWVLAATGAIRYFTDVEVLRVQIERLGMLGPVVVMFLMAANIVFSPLPSAPILLAAGAVWGPFMGTVWVLVGAQIGSLIAFFIARFLGADVVQRWFGENATLRMIGTQNRLMAIVFVTRLVPFMSFDLVSYGAGLTPLTWWRFLIANLAGMIPMNFVLVQVGDGMLAGEPVSLAVTAVSAGAIAGFALLLAWLLHRRGIRPPEAAGDPSPAPDGSREGG